MIVSLRNSLLSIVIFTCIFISVSFAVPLHQLQFQRPLTTPLIKKVPSLLYLENYNILNNVDDHYNAIVTQVLDSTISEIIETASETYLTIHELQIIGRGHCRTSATDFIKILEYELEHRVKDSLLASIRPLINRNYNEKTSIIDLNTILSEELGLLLNAQQVADNVMKQVYQRVDTLASVWRSFTNKRWAETVHHERNESIALKAWLCSWLLDIEFTLKDMFDSQISALI
ncbi:hypothetical protein EDC94DRAFT_695454 [Helicostylum pulchrum]|nr:hypothetical protein EDC94DRAFT_695454 [Helicostylum pulchrum]